MPKLCLHKQVAQHYPKYYLETLFDSMCFMSINLALIANYNFPAPQLFKINKKLQTFTGALTVYFSSQRVHLSHGS